MSIKIPSDFIARPAIMGDLKEAVDLFNACSLDLLGVRQHDLHEQEVDWKTPMFNLETDSCAVLTLDGDLVGYADVWDGDEPHIQAYSFGKVHPEYRGRGIGTALLAWQEERAHEAIAKAPPEAKVCLGQVVNSKDEGAKALLETHGYKVVRHFWRMEIVLDTQIPVPQWPKGITVRTFDPESDLLAVAKAVRDEFKDHWGFFDTPLEQELEQWRHWITEDKNFDPPLWFLAMDGDNIAGTALCWPKNTEDPEMGWVNVLGVGRPWRRRGLAIALLHNAFAEFAGRGKSKVGLGVDATSLTGANRVYERAGMHPTRQRDVYEKELRPGVDLRRHTLDVAEA
ncbi:MAG: GNAT family N-acetyltransferase [Nitrospirae bacterium]|nr:GNAT family N-acetyltransferase [Nitrospirota bacterium]